MDSTQESEWIDSHGEPGLVSIIIPVFNRPQFVIDALDSAASQRYRPIEVLVVDDGSTDDTGNRVQQWIADQPADRDLTYRYLHKVNGGAPSARNRGIRECRGEFIQLLDSDDFLGPDKIEAQVAALRAEPDAGFVTSAIRYFPSMPDLTRWSTSAQVVHKGPMRSPYEAPRAATLLVRRSLYACSGPWNEALPQWQDWEYAFRLLSCRPGLVQLAGPHFGVRIHGSGRIGDLVGTRDGVLARLSALASMAALSRSDDRAHTRPILRTLYLKTLEQAVSCGSREDAERCLAEWRQADPSAAGWLLRGGARTVLGLLGARGFGAMIRWLRRLRR